MAITLTGLTSGGAAGAGDVVTASVSPSGPVLLAALIDLSSASTGTPLTVSGCGLTWTNIEWRILDGGLSIHWGVWIGTGTPSSGAITIATGAHTIQRRFYSVSQLDGATATPLVGTADFASEGSTDGTLPITISPAMTAGNGGFMMSYWFGGAGTAVAKSGWSEIHEVAADGNTFHTQWINTTDTTSEVDFSGSGGTVYGLFMEFEAASADTQEPTLSSPTATETGSTTGDGSVSTDEGNGTLYFVVTTSSTGPSAAQVQAGQDHTGAAAVDSGSQAVSGTGVQNISGGFSGLTPSTAYYAHYQHRDAATNDSTVVSSSSFTTDAAPTGGVPSLVGPGFLIGSGRLVGPGPLFG